MDVLQCAQWMCPRSLGLVLLICTLVTSVHAELGVGGINIGGLHDRRFDPNLARWYIPDDLPGIFVEDHEDPPLSFAEAYGHYVRHEGINFWDSHWIRFFYQWVYQMKSSPLRVHSPEAADFVFVPVCLGSWCGARPTSPLYFRSNAYRWTHSSQDRATYFFGIAPKLLPWLGRKPHVLVFNGAIPGSMLREAAKNFTFIGLETGLGWPQARFLTAPYPSHEHHDINEPMPPLDSLLLQKTKLAVGIYVVRRAISDGSAMTRVALYNSCIAHPDICTHITWEMSHNMSYKAAAYSNYTSHWYCLQPPGDWALRGAFYDCVVAGGVPIVFHRNYPMHVAYADFFNYTTMLRVAPAVKAAGSSFDYLAYLQEEYSKGNATAELEAWRSIGRVFQYAVNPDHLLITWKDRNKRSPLDDAFTFSMKALLRSLCQHDSLQTLAKCQ